MFREWLMNEEMHTGQGRVVVSPKPKGRYKTATRPWWMIIEVDEEIGRYYRELLSQFSKAQYKNLRMPEWGTHISIVRGEEPPNMELWLNWEGKVVHFEYSHDIKQMPFTPYLWLPAKCPDAEAIRLELGLSKEPQYGYHLTFARKEKAEEDL
jgi:hypothetical protein